MSRHAPLVIALLSASHAFYAGERAPRRAACALRALSDRLLRDCGLATGFFHKRQCYYPLRVQALDLCWPVEPREPRGESNPLWGFRV